MSKKYTTKAKATRIAIKGDGSKTSTTGNFSNKPFILQDSQQTPQDVQAYQALRSIFRNNRTSTYSLASLTSVDLDMFDEIVEMFIPQQLPISSAKPKTDAIPKKRFEKDNDSKKKRKSRKKAREDKMWTPEV